ncbi:MAG: hypothetical protein ABH849_04300 [Nanoarchaeota archaeon]
MIDLLLVINLVNLALTFLVIISIYGTLLRTKGRIHTSYLFVFLALFVFAARIFVKIFTVQPISFWPIIGSVLETIFLILMVVAGNFLKSVFKVLNGEKRK